MVKRKHNPKRVSDVLIIHKSEKYVFDQGHVFSLWVILFFFFFLTSASSSEIHDCLSESSKQPVLISQLAMANTFLFIVNPKLAFAWIINLCLLLKPFRVPLIFMTSMSRRCCMQISTVQLQKAVVRTHLYSSSREEINLTVASIQIGLIFH